MSLFTKQKTEKFLNSEGFNKMLNAKLAEHSKTKDEETKVIIDKKDKELEDKQKELDDANDKLELAKLKENEDIVVKDTKGTEYTLSIHNKGEKDA